MRHLPFALLLAALLQACGVPKSDDEFFATAEAQFLEATARKLAARDFASIKALMDDRVQQADIDQALERLARSLPPGNPVATEAVDWRHFTKKGFAGDGPTLRTAAVAVQYTYEANQWVVASATLSGEPGAFQILAFNVEPLPAPLSEIHALTLKGKGPLHYLFSLLALTSVGVVLFAFVRCVHTPGLKRKWLWVIFTLFGFAAFTLNWTNGTTSFQLVHINLIGFGLSRQGWLGAWELTFALPVGALVFLLAHPRQVATRESDG
jgi:hypothetical protein